MIKSKGKHDLSSLDPFVDKEGILRVGGRLKHSSLPFEIKHALILPKTSQISKCIIMFYHESVFHSGRGITINTIRENGIWIISMTSLCNF